MAMKAIKVRKLGKIQMFSLAAVLAMSAGHDSIVLGNGSGFPGGMRAIRGHYLLLDPGFSCPDGRKPGYREMISSSEAPCHASRGDSCPYLKTDPCSDVSEEIPQSEESHLVQPTELPFVDKVFRHNLAMYGDAILENLDGVPTPSHPDKWRVVCQDGMYFSNSMELFISESSGHADATLFYFEPYTGDNPNLHFTAKQVGPFAVNEHHLGNGTIIYRDPDFEIRIDGSHIASSHILDHPGKLRLKVDGKEKRGTLSCWISK